MLATGKLRQWLGFWLTAMLPVIADGGGDNTWCWLGLGVLSGSLVWIGTELSLGAALRRRDPRLMRHLERHR